MAADLRWELAEWPFPNVRQILNIRTYVRTFIGVSVSGGHGKSKIKYTNLIVNMDRLPDPRRTLQMKMYKGTSTRTWNSRRTLGSGRIGNGAAGAQNSLSDKFPLAVRQNHRKIEWTWWHSRTHDLTNSRWQRAKETASCRPNATADSPYMPWDYCKSGTEIALMREATRMSKQALSLVPARPPWRNLLPSFFFLPELPYEQFVVELPAVKQALWITCPYWNVPSMHEHGRPESHAQCQGVSTQVLLEW
jgi:hypothetical protein